MMRHLRCRSSGKYLSDYLQDGYTYGDKQIQHGTVSRTPVGADKIRVYIADGRRKKQPFILVPGEIGTRYCYRQYLVKGDNGGDTNGQR